MRLLLLTSLLWSIVSSQVTCPDGYTAPATYTGFCYKFNSATLTWNAHENACTQVTLNGVPYAGGHLATIFDQPSATVVMNQYCNSLNRGATYYFIGYYCISSSYTSRPDWRWTSGKSTTWLHSAPTYLSGAEPDDFGCGLAHYSDDGANTGRVGDWSCGSPLSGGCCEAPVVPTPSASITASSTATSTLTATATRTRTASNTETATASPTYTQTGTRTGTASTTRTGSRSATETRTATATATSTNTATATVTPSESPTISPSVSGSVSASVSDSPSVSPSVSQSVSMTVSPSKSVSISFTPRPIALAGFGALGAGANGVLGDGSGSGSSMNMGGVGSEAEMAAVEAAAAEAAQTKTVIIASSAAGGAALLAALCALWLCACLARRRKEQKARSAAAAAASRKSYVVAAGKLGRTQQQTIGGVLGAAPPARSLGPRARVGFKAQPTSMRHLFGSMNPALVQVAPVATPGKRNPRMTMALSAYKNTAAFKPVSVARQSLAPALLEEPEETVDDSALNVEQQDPDSYAVGIAEETDEDVAQETDALPSDYTVAEALEETAEEETAEEEDAADDEEAVDAALRSKVGGRTATGGGWLTNKVKKTTESAVAPPFEHKKLVIGKGALLEEQVEKQTVKLRRVSKVKGDKDLTALRNAVSRPSIAVARGFEPQRPMSYAFTATVSRTLVKKEETETPNALYGLE